MSEQQDTSTPKGFQSPYNMSPTQKTLPNQPLRRSTSPPYCLVSFKCALAPISLATVTASLNARPRWPRTPPSSSTITPPIVHPSGLVPRSFSTPGCTPPCSIAALPAMLWKTIALATSRGTPTATLASTSASHTIAKKAGVEPATAVVAAIRRGGTRTVRPTRWKMRSVRSSRAGGGGESSGTSMAVREWATRAAMLGRVRTMVAREEEMGVA